MDTYGTIYSSGDNQEYSPSQAVEYLIETDQNESQPEIEIDGNEQLFHQNADDDEHQFHILPVEHIVENSNSLSASQEDTKQNIEYQEAFITETLNSSNIDSLDSWLTGIKETLLSFPKLLRARAKKQINDLVSEFEINYLESLK